jgi:ureidoacrylate peracid hydrolase
MNSKKAALILIDLQNDFCHPEGTASKRGKNTVSLRAGLDRMKGLLESARQQGIPVFHVVSEHSARTESPSGKERFGRSNRDSRLHYCEPGTWGAEIYEPFTPIQKEQVIVKHRYSAFVHTNLEFLLRRNAIEHVTIIGAYTNVCIDSSARDAYMRDFEVTVPYDAVVSDNKKLHDQALTLLEGTFAEIVHSSAIEEQWKIREENS